MPTHAATADDLLDRWRAGRTFRPGSTRKRQVAVLLLLLLLATLICAYWYVTDSNRVREMAQVELSRLVQGKVEIRKASLSIFEGLRLDGVSVRVDESSRDDSVVFTAQTLLVKYNAAALLTDKRLVLTQIVALDPHVRLCENLGPGVKQWNYQRLGQRPAMGGGGGGGGGRPEALPEIFLRSGQVDYSRFVDGKYESLGSMAIEGQMAPTIEPGHYRVELESRGVGQTIGPTLRGTIDMETHAVTAELRSLDFRGSIASMLPTEVQEWLDRHGLSGKIDVPAFSYRPARDGSKASFRIETDLEKVGLVVRREEFLSRDERHELEAIRASCERMRACRFNPAGGVDLLQQAYDGEAIQLSWVTGKFIFTQDGIEIRNVSGWVENNSFAIAGHIDGYSPNATASLELVSNEIYIPESPRYLASLPPQVRIIYGRLRPTGTARLKATTERTIVGGPVRTSGDVQILDGAILYQAFPYPLVHIAGRVTFGHDDQTGHDWLRIHDARGHGRDGSANATATFIVNGFISPLDDTNRVVLDVKADSVTLDDGMYAALSPDVRRTMGVFAGPGRKYPVLRGDVVCNVDRPEGLDREFRTDVDIVVQDGAGRYTDFPYPLDHIEGTLSFRPDYVDVKQLRMTRGKTTLALDGRIRTFADGRSAPDLALTATGLPIDQDLLGALPPKEREALAKLGLAGVLDIDGRLTPPAAGARGDFGYDLNLNLRGGKLWPVEDVYALTDLSAQMRLTSEGLDVKQFDGKRGESPVAGKMEIRWPEDTLSVKLSAAARELRLDGSLYKLMPPDVRTQWDQLKPEGTVDAEVGYTSGPGVKAGEGMSVVLHPRKLAVTYQEVPYRLENLGGSISITPTKVILDDIVGRHGEATVHIAGSGTLGARPEWQLRITGEGMVVDDDLRKALPQSLTSLIDSVKLQGKLGFECEKLTYKLEDVAAGADGKPPAARLDFKAKVNLVDASLDVGMPLASATGVLDLGGYALDGKLVELNGKVRVSSMQLSGRAVKGLECDLLKPAGRDAMQLANLTGKLAGGDLAGQIDLGWPQQSPGQYALQMVVRGADVRQLSNEAAKGPQGQVTASLALQGDWGSPKSRRGRGDVLVSGKELYHIPLVLGLLQITNLALPISAPFNEATIRYNVEGQKVNFEGIELRAGNMVMQGSGWLDYDTKKVKMTFVTDTPGWKIPLLHDLWQGAKQELLQIHVNGSVQEPQVSARALNTFTTTVDEVFKGNDPARPNPGKPKKNGQ